MPPPVAITQFFSSAKFFAYFDSSFRKKFHPFFSTIFSIVAFSSCSISRSISINLKFKKFAKTFPTADFPLPRIPIKTRFCSKFFTLKISRFLKLRRRTTRFRARKLKTIFLQKHSTRRVPHRPRSRRNKINFRSSKFQKHSRRTRLKLKAFRANPRFRQLFSFQKFHAEILPNLPKIRKTFCDAILITDLDSRNFQTG